jgi:hypothetical protein
VLKVLAAATAVTATVATSAAGATAAKPSLRLVATTPVKVAGAHFGRREHVRVRITTPSSTVTRRTVTTSAGTFVVGSSAQFDPCSGPLVVRAIGSRGSDAVLKLPPRECPPA